MKKFAALALVAVSVLAGCGGATSSETSLDVQYIDMMVPHHESAVAMAELAVSRSQRAEVQGFAAAILAAQGPEITQLKMWRKAWHGSDVTPPMSEMPMLDGMSSSMPGHGMHGATMDMGADVRTLEAAGDFDRVFLELMIVHHAMAVEASKIIAAGQVRTELAEFAAQVLADQQAEIIQMEAWLSSW